MSEIAPLVCAGSGKYPLESVLLDTVPGVDPRGTCSVCKKPMSLRGYRLPQHAETKPESDGGESDG